jgi:GGDEF domain-containing protein
VSGQTEPTVTRDAATVSIPRPPRAMLAITIEAGDGPCLWCDPLTGLIAYPSFAEHFTDRLPTLAPLGVHLAIGDVDDLKEYVSQRRAEDHTHFGHLAGNECMQTIGRITRRWAERTVADWPFSLCGTFGGDEVIIAAAGVEYAAFVNSVQELLDDIGRNAPRTCSFAVGTLLPTTIPEADRAIAYREFVARVDLALFERKAEIRAANVSPRGDLEDIGSVTFGNGDPRPDMELVRSIREEMTA